MNDYVSCSEVRFVMIKGLDIMERVLVFCDLFVFVR